MKNIKCLFGNHVYSDASLEVNVVDKKDGYLVCHVMNYCLHCGKPYEVFTCIPIPKWFCEKREEKRK